MGIVWFLIFSVFWSMLYGSECGRSWWVFPASLRKVHTLLLLDEVVGRSLVSTWWMVCRVRRVLADFLPAVPHCFRKRGADVSSHERGFVSFFLKFWSSISFCPRSLMLWCWLLCLLRELTPLSYCPSLSLLNFFTLKSTLSEINIAMPDSFWLLLTWYIFPIHLVLTYMCLYM